MRDVRLMYVSCLPPGPLPPAGMTFNDVLLLPPAQDVIRVVPSLSTTDSNSVIEVFFQIGPDGTKRD